MPPRKKKAAAKASKAEKVREPVDEVIFIFILIENI